MSGPLRVVIGEDDVLLREGIARLLTEAGSMSSLRPATPRIYCASDGVTEIVSIPDRGHALTVDAGWRTVADTALAFVKRFV